MKHRIQCKNRRCRWTGFLSDLKEVFNSKRSSVHFAVYSRVCPSCGCNACYSIHEPKPCLRSDKSCELTEAVIGGRGGIMGKIGAGKQGIARFIDNYANFKKSN
jgi:hypothetical protein